MSKFDLNEITENTKQAREATLVGKYDEALVFYESVIHMINRHVTQTKDQNAKQKWQQVIKVLNDILYVYYIRTVDCQGGVTHTLTVG